MKVLFINVNEKSFWEENVEHEKIKGILDLGIFFHLEKYKSYSKHVFSPENALVIGCGNLSYSGSQRAVFIFRSPLHGGIHSSTMGGLGEYIKKAGYNAIVIEGKSEQSIFVAVKNNEVKFIETELPQNIFIKEHKLYKELKNFYQGILFRIALCGLGSETTKYGCIVSSKPGKIGVVSDIAGRGGAGSVLYRAHNVVGISIGGNLDIKITTSPDFVKQQMEATKKYREKGTFGANYLHLKENTILFNWLSFLLPKEKRLQIFSKFIEQELLKNYSFSSDTCGERCVAVCKKIESKVKIDYEPVEGLGPFIGIFNRTYIKTLLHTIDSLGLDAIYFGSVLGAVFEALHKEVIPKDIFSLDETPVMDCESPNSEKNFMIAKYLIEKISYGELAILGENIRILGKELGITDLALYIPHGNEFDMTPNFYWSLGLMLPIVMHGKYFSDYHTVVKPPEEYAKICAERSIMEYILDNLGICRFHRAWAESKISEDVLNTSKFWIAKLWEYKKKANALPKFWESKRTIEVIKKLFEEHGSGEWKNVDESKIKEYWNAWQKEYLKNLEIKD